MKRAKKTVHRSCSVERRVLVTTSMMSLATGEITGPTLSEWHTKACGVPLFLDDEQARGVCRSCASGWTHENNYPTESGRSQLRVVLP